MRLLKKGSLVVFCLFFFFLLQMPAYAEEEETTKDAQQEALSDFAGQTGFTVEVIPAENQINEEFGFFYVHVNPLEEQVLQVKIISTREEPSVIKISLSDAVTNSSGQIGYGAKNVEFDESLKFPLTTMVALSDAEITVENYEEKIVEFKVTPPKETFSGIRLGAISLLSDDNEAQASAVSSSYGYKIGLMVSEDLTPYNVGGTLKYKKVSPKLESGQKVIATTLQNPEPHILENVTMSSKLKKRGEEEVLASNTLEGMRIAPNTSFDFLTYLGLEELEAGKYTIEMTASDGNEHWDWTKDFEIGAKEAKKINEETAYKLVMPRKYKYLLAGLLAFSFLNVGYLVFRGGKKNGQEKKEKVPSFDSSSR